MGRRRGTGPIGTRGATRHSILLGVIVAGSVLTNFVVGQHGPLLLRDETPGFPRRAARSPRSAELTAGEEAAQLLAQIDFDELRARADVVTPPGLDAAIELSDDSIAIELWTHPADGTPATIAAKESHPLSGRASVVVGGDVRALRGSSASEVTIAAAGDVTISGELHGDAPRLSGPLRASDVEAIVVLARGSIRTPFKPGDAIPRIEATLLAVDGSVDVPAEATPGPAVDAALASLLGMRGAK